MTDDGDLAPDARTSPPHAMPVDPDVSADPEDRASARSLSLHQQARRILVARWDILLVIAAGGALGSLARWGLGEALPAGPDSFPWATFSVNVSGCFALGVLMVFVVEVWPPSRYVRPFVGVGVLGGFTTFSTYLLDTRTLVADDHAPLAAVYLFATLAVGIVAVWLGIAAARLSTAPAHRQRRRR